MATEEMARRGAASMAKMMGLICVADSKLGEFKEGLCPATRTGDYSDVVVMDADGRIVPWQRVARFDASEMRQTRREIVDKRAACKTLIDSERRKNTQASSDVGARQLARF